MAAMQAAASATPTPQRAGPAPVNHQTMPHLADRQHAIQLTFQPAAVPSLLGSALPSPSYGGVPFAILAASMAGQWAPMRCEALYVPAKLHHMTEGAHTQFVAKRLMSLMSLHRQHAGADAAAEQR